MKDVKKIPMFERKDWKARLYRFIQFIFFFLRNNNYFDYKILKQHDKLKYSIKRDTNWLTVTTSRKGKDYKLPFYKQAIKYFEYKNMVIQRRAQYVIIFLTITLLIMTGLQIYLNFFQTKESIAYSKMAAGIANESLTQETNKNICDDADKRLDEARNILRDQKLCKSGIVAKNEKIIQNASSLRTKGKCNDILSLLENKFNPTVCSIDYYEGPTIIPQVVRKAPVGWFVVILVLITGLIVYFMTYLKEKKK